MTQIIIIDMLKEKKIEFLTYQTWKSTCLQNGNQKPTLPGARGIRVRRFQTNGAQN